MRSTTKATGRRPGGSDASDLEGSGFASRAELANWLSFVAWRSDPDADPSLYLWIDDVTGWVPRSSVQLGEPAAKRNAPPARAAHGAQRLPLSPWAADAVAGLPALLTTDEAIGVLRTSRRNLYRWIAAGKLRAVRSGVAGSARVLVPRESIAAFLSQLS